MWRGTHVAEATTAAFPLPTVASNFDGKTAMGMMKKDAAMFSARSFDPGSALSRDLNCPVTCLMNVGERGPMVCSWSAASVGGNAHLVANGGMVTGSSSS